MISAHGSDPSRSSTTTQSLLEALKAMNSEAWVRFVDLYSPYVYSLCRGAALSPEDAQDVFQEVFKSAAHSLGNFVRRKEGGTLRGWVVAVTRSKIVDQMRRAAHEFRAAGGSSALRRVEQIPDQRTVRPDEPWEPSASASGLHQLLNAALDRTRPHFQGKTFEAFRLSVLEGRPTRDVAEELGMSVGAVRIARSRVLARLHAELGDGDQGPAPKD